MNFCSDCGRPVSLLVPPDDNRMRHVCSHCGTIHYQNPKMVIGSIPLWEADGRVLLCRRAIEPRHGFWTLPAGFMELGETTAEGALRLDGRDITRWSASRRGRRAVRVRRRVRRPWTASSRW